VVGRQLVPRLVARVRPGRRAGAVKRRASAPSVCSTTEGNNLLQFDQAFATTNRQRAERHPVPLKAAARNGDATATARAELLSPASSNRRREKCPPLTW
jgi:hypothetical protein